MVTWLGTIQRRLAFPCLTLHKSRSVPPLLDPINRYQLPAGIPKSSTLVGFCFINNPFWGSPILGNPQMLPRSMFGDVFHLTHFIGLNAVNSELITTLAVQILTRCGTIPSYSRFKMASNGGFLKWGYSKMHGL